MSELPYMVVKWGQALTKKLEPLGDYPTTAGEAAALGLHWGLSDWQPGDRETLVELAVKGDHNAFVTLACRDWTLDADRTRLPKELQLKKEGRALHEQTSMLIPARTPDDALVAG